MKLTCPGCHLAFPIEAALEVNAQRDAYAALMALTPFPDHLTGYLQLFAPLKRAISGSKKARLTAEMAAMIKAARFDFKGVSYSAPLEYWRGGFETLQSMREAGSLELPLQSHNLLLAVMAKQINKSETRKEQQHEDRLAGRTPVGGQIPPNPPLTKGGAQNAGDSRPRAKMPAEVLAAAGITKSNTVGDNDGNNQ